MSDASPFPDQPDPPDQPAEPEEQEKFSRRVLDEILEEAATADTPRLVKAWLHLLGRLYGPELDIRQVERLVERILDHRYGIGNISRRVFRKIAAQLWDDPRAMDHLRKLWAEVCE